MATSLYRKYRPVGFDGVIGQEHIVKTLTNQIKSDRIGHAYLFTGSRGTGKTTCAKIFSRAINCSQPVDGSPCGVCEICRALIGNNNLDISEIDAASNNGVDDAREIRENVKYPPISGRYKVYIIDEVHMLTGSAFNALLKTLEEPPNHAVFILATTEVHKLPATILSRCMRFDFRLVANDKIAELIKGVYDLEGKKYEEEAINLIASLGDGSVRDALSVADKCLNINEGVLKYDDVLNATGVSDRSLVRELFEAIAIGNVGETLIKIDSQAKLGKSINLIAKEIISYSRDLLLLKSGADSMVLETKENLVKLKEEKENYSVDLLVSFIQIFCSIDSEIRYSVNPKLALESAAIRACRLKTMDFNGIEERIARIERQLSNCITQNNGVGMRETQESAHTKNSNFSSENIIKNSTINTQINDINEPKKEPKTVNKPMDALSVWGRLTTYFRMNESMSYFTLAGNHHDVEISENYFVIWANSDNYLLMSDEGFINAVKRALIADNINLEVSVDKRKISIDMDNELNELKKLFGNKVPVNVKK